MLMPLRQAASLEEQSSGLLKELTIKHCESMTLSICLCKYASINMPLTICLFQCASPSMCLSLNMPLSMFLFQCASPSMCLSLDMPLSMFLFQNASPSICHYVCASVRWPHSRSRAVALKRAHNQTLTENACLSQNASINLPLSKMCLCQVDSLEEQSSGFE